jgi:hypothetical protein
MQRKLIYLAVSVLLLAAGIAVIYLAMSYGLT